LNLKFVAHHGTVLRQRIAGREELLGSDVIVAHRLLKNQVSGSTGIGAYALLTQACVDATDVDPVALGMRAVTETSEHIGDVPAWAHDLERRWQEEESRTRVYVEPAQAAYELSATTSAPPQLAWEHVTAPGRRVAWQAGTTAVELVSAPGNRRGVGAINHCMHGKDATIEEILDWRPYDYVTDRSTMGTPAGTVRFRSTTEIEPTSTGSIIRIRIEAPKSAKERAIFSQMMPMIERVMEQGRKKLLADLDAALAEASASS
ncbi:MAG: DUF2652 domain-containing protein, partial [Candidatus Limnocylindrales bacterium]